MLILSKFTRLEESTIFKMRCILTEKKNGETVLDVQNRTKTKFYDASEFLHAMDILFVLDMIEVDANSGLVHYA